MLSQWSQLHCTAGSFWVQGQRVHHRSLLRPVVTYIDLSQLIQCREYRFAVKVSACNNLPSKKSTPLPPPLLLTYCAPVCWRHLLQHWQHWGVAPLHTPGPTAHKASFRQSYRCCVLGCDINGLMTRGWRGLVRQVGTQTPLKANQVDALHGWLVGNECCGES